jgi:succinyl-CoA synthetase beta subunit
MLIENPDIAEIDINPLLVLENGAVALDARAVVNKHVA